MKLFEEAGELAKEVNKSSGMKVSDDNADIIRDGVLDEAADTIQCIFSVIIEFNKANPELANITYEELAERIGVKNDKWFNNYTEN
jgi:NTP pyrophosphatase (non-canonical NTP hydrolase)